MEVPRKLHCRPKKKETEGASGVNFLSEGITSSCNSPMKPQNEFLLSMKSHPRTKGAIKPCSHLWDKQIKHKHRKFIQQRKRRLLMRACSISWNTCIHFSLPLLFRILTLAVMLIAQEWTRLNPRTPKRGTPNRSFGPKIWSFQAIKMKISVPVVL